MTSVGEWTGRRRIVHGLAWLCLVIAPFPIVWGALVTSYGVGMAVPDGHTTFGQTLWMYNFVGKPFGVQLEHTHRLWGMAIGLCTLALTLAAFFLDDRKAVRYWVLASFGAVLLQGSLGILRVDRNDIRIAAVHGAFAQLFLAMLTTIVVLTSRKAESDDGIEHPLAISLQRHAFLIAAAVYLQIVVGVVLRHRNGLFHVHATIAYAATLLIVAFGVRVLVDERLRGRLAVYCGWLFAGVFLQVILGNASALLTGVVPREFRPPITNLTAVTTSLHVVVGSGLLIASVVAALATRRMLRPPAMREAA